MELAIILSIYQLSETFLELLDDLSELLFHVSVLLDFFMEQASHRLCVLIKSLKLLLALLQLFLSFIVCQGQILQFIFVATQFVCMLDSEFL